MVQEGNCGVMEICYCWTATTEQFSASDLCSDDRVARMWVRILAANHGACVVEQDM